MSFTITLVMSGDDENFGYEDNGTNISMILGPGCNVNWGDSSANTIVTSTAPLPPHSCGSTIVITGPNTLTSMRLEGNFAEEIDLSKGKWISSISGTLPSKLVSLYLSVSDTYTNTLVFPKTLTTLHYLGNGPDTLGNSVQNAIFPSTVNSIRLPKNAEFVNIAKCSKLTLASIYSTPIRSVVRRLIWPNNLKTVDFSLFTVDGGGIYTGAGGFILYGNSLTSVNFSETVDFQILQLNCPKLTTMPIFNKSELTMLNISETAIKTVNMSNCTSLVNFYIPLIATSLNLSGCTSLEKTALNNFGTLSKLSSINVSGCSSLERAILPPSVKTADFRNTPLATFLSDSSKDGLYIVSPLFTFT
jgi:hypothetical protein